MIFQLLLLFAVLSTSFCYESNRIINGHKISIEEVPFQVAVFRYSTHWCGGSLMSKKFVLSAAHCFDTPNSVQISTVIVGTNTPNDGSGMSINIQYVFNHPKYDWITLDYDITLIRLNDVDNFPPVVQFAKLPTGFDKLNDGDDVFISGWGMTELGTNSKVLLGATVQIQNFKYCVHAYRNVNKVTKRMICAGKVEGQVDACHGDSGGPLVRKYDGILFGITSFGKYCGLPNYPGVYTKVSYFLGWIYETISLDSKNAKLRPTESELILN